jgi:hypothetical protein
MGEPLKNIEEINVVDEFLSEEEDPNNSGEALISSKSNEDEKDFTESLKESESYLDENMKKNETSNDNDREEDYKANISFLRNINQNKKEENETYKAPINEKTSSLSNETQCELIEKLKYHYGEMTLLFDALESEILDSRKTINNQKSYISKIEDELLKYKTDAEEAIKNYRLTRKKLDQAEKKLEIVKKELLD